jgi:signal transduction histidine kinase/ActR/RegA family two-component response regulator
MTSLQPLQPVDSRDTERRRGLSLQQKSWLVTVGVLIALAALLALGIDRVFREGSQKLESQWVAETARRVLAAQSAEVDGLERSTRDYATWTDTYEYMGGTLPDYVENNLLPATFANLQLDAFLLFDTSGELRMGRVHRDGVVTADRSRELALKLQQIALDSSTNSRLLKGVTEVADGLALFSVMPVLRDDSSGPPRGALAQLRFLDATRIQRLRDSVNFDLVLRVGPTPSRQTEADQVAAFSTEIISEGTLRLHIPIRGTGGEQLGEWELTLPRDIHLQGVHGRLIFYIVMIVLIIAAAAVIGWMLRHLVISRLEALHAVVKRVGVTSDLSVRLPLHGADELTSVNEGINHMLEALEKGEAARLAAEREREQLNKQLQEAQKLEAIGTLTGGLAHDFNNLLTSIQGSATLLRLEAANSAGDEHLRRIDNATAHGARLVRQMMAFGRRAPTNFAPVHLPDVVRDALQLLRPSVPKGIEFHFHNEAVNDLVNADAAQLQQVLVNVATNSSHAMADGVGQFIVKISEVRLPDSARPETTMVAAGDYLRVELSDTGVGIPPDSLPRIFEPFYTTKPVGSGTGLGLAVVHGIVTQHHGVIGVESEVGRGTTFFIHLPRHRRSPAANGSSPGKTNGAKATGDAGSILLVDDDVMVRETLEAGLRRRKYRITCASGGAQALKLIRENRGAYDAVITDQMMPGMTGTEFGAIVAQENPGLPMILVTGFASALNEAKVKAMGFTAMLMKPVTIDELDGVVRRAQRH